jgi:hypothetical protein
MVSARRPDEVWILARSLLVPWSQNRSAIAVSPGERIKLLSHRVNRVVVWIFVSRRERQPLSASYAIIAGGQLETPEEPLTRAVLHWDCSAEAQ